MDRYAFQRGMETQKLRLKAGIDQGGRKKSGKNGWEKWMGKIKTTPGKIANQEKKLQRDGKIN